jgi:hypothetical protein
MMERIVWAVAAGVLFLGVAAAGFVLGMAIRDIYRSARGLNRKFFK